MDLGGSAMSRVAKDYGYTLAELRKLSDNDQMCATLRVEFSFDDEARNWHYRVPKDYDSDAVMLDVSVASAA